MPVLNLIGQHTSINFLFISVRCVCIFLFSIFVALVVLLKLDLLFLLYGINFYQHKNNLVYKFIN